MGVQHVEVTLNSKAPLAGILAPTKLSNLNVMKHKQTDLTHVFDENQSAIDKLVSQLVNDDDDDDTKLNNFPNDDIKQDELLRLKQELQAAKSQIAFMDQQLLAQHRSNKPNSALDSPSELSLNGPSEPWTQVNPRSSGSREDSPSDSGVPLIISTLDKYPQAPWLEDSPALMPVLNTPVTLSTPPMTSQAGWGGPPPPSAFPGGPYGRGPWQNSTLRLDTSEPYRSFTNNVTNSPPEQSYLRTSFPTNRPGSAFGSYSSYTNSAYNSTYSTGYSPPITPIGFQQPPYQPRPIGTPLSPTATEFSTGTIGGNPWNMPAPSENSSSGYVPPMEPLNYRRLLEKNMNCNWKFIVDKIVCSNDQQASIFLQQKLKSSTPDQKYELVEAIISQAYPLMINRFGNFLVQRCFEHGTPEQIICIANAIRGNTLALSMDPFGCHVVQKAFDVVPEDYKAIMVHELLRRIPETVIHRYACHVWQKLFELRWSDSPPQIMKYVNEALRGMWHEVALGETGSLVVQNIFENCLEEDKRPCINEVLGSIDVVSHGQFGNWCIQHICEHGAAPDKTRAIEHVLRLATEYSTDQFASKVVEKCLKVGGTDFLDRYLEKVCEGRADRPRMPLIDIAGDQHGNYLIQYILIHADPQRREIVAAHIRKHMVSLRGSKFGSRVAMLCCNPSSATRPGPGMAIHNASRFMPQQPMTMGLAPGPGSYGRPGYGPYN